MSLSLSHAVPSLLRLVVFIILTQTNRIAGCFSTWMLAGLALVIWWRVPVANRQKMDNALLRLFLLMVYLSHSCSQSFIRLSLSLSMSPSTSASIHRLKSEIQIGGILPWFVFRERWRARGGPKRAPYAQIAGVCLWAQCDCWFAPSTYLFYVKYVVGVWMYRLLFVRRGKAVLLLEIIMHTAYDEWDAWRMRAYKEAHCGVLRICRDFDLWRKLDVCARVLGSCSGCSLRDNARVTRRQRK